MAGAVARVILDSPLPQLDHPFDYLVPDELSDAAVPGVRVSVPLRGAGRLAQGWLIERVSESDFGGQLAELRAVLGSFAVLPPQLYELARRVADRSAGTVSDVLRLAIPPRHVRAEKAVLAESFEASSEAQCVARELTGYAAGTAAALSQAGARTSLSAIPRLLGTDDGAIPHWCASFAELAAVVLARGESAILAVPDYRDQRALARALHDVIPAERIITVDARQRPAERYTNYLRLIRGGSYVVLGNRSAVYSPISNAGLIAIWDDSDPSYREQHAPGVHARDVALIRQEQTGCALVFAGYARSTETQRLVELAWLTACEPERTVRPRVILEQHERGSGLGSAAYAAAKEAIADGPVLLQVAHPGYSSSGMCAKCHLPARCQRCAGALFLPNPRRPAQCRLCGALATSWRCPHCQHDRIQPVGNAAGRTAEELGKAFPGVPVVVSDGERAITELPDRPALVIATRGAEPIAARGYRAVVLLDAARMLAREGLSVSEDALRWWTTAASFAAPDAPVFLPQLDGELPRAFATWSLNSWVSRELAARRALRLPPAVRVASIRGTPELLREAQQVMDRVDAPVGSITVLGPVAIDAEESQLTVRCDYAVAAVLVAALKALQVRVATRGRTLATRGTSRPQAVLRVRMDDPEVYE